jgi:uncharacterized membrane protein
MATLTIAALFWLFIHLGIAGSPLRGVLVARLGDNGFRGLFSLLSAVGLAGLIWGYGAARGAENVALWSAPPWLHWLAVILMLPASILLVGSLTIPNPGLVGAEKLLQRAEPARGMLRITRHPMLIAFALWALLHLLANGDLASALLFGSVLIVAVAGAFSIDRKRNQAMPADWPRFAAVTSILPLAAVASGRNRLVTSELWLPLAVGALVWLGLLLLHPLVIGVPALPG